jgi:hypothetical protein
MGLSDPARAAIEESVHQGTNSTRTWTTRRGAVTAVDPANRIALVGVAVGPDGSDSFGAEIIAPVHVMVGDLVQVLFVPPAKAFVVGRIGGDHDDWHIVGDEGEPLFGSGWAAEGTTGPPSFGGPAEPMFTRRGDRTELRGWAERSSGSTDTVFELPEPYWPDNDLLIPALTGLGAHTIVSVSGTTGAVAVAAGVDLLIMDGVSFLARAQREAT